MMRQTIFVVIGLGLTLGSVGRTQAEPVVFVAVPSSQKLIEDSKTGHITFTIANSKTVEINHNDFTVPIYIASISFDSFKWIGGDPDKDDKPVNPHWQGPDGLQGDPLNHRQGLGNIVPTGPAVAEPYADFIFSTLPAHIEVPPDYDAWSMEFTLSYFFPNDQIQMQDNTGQSWAGLATTTATATIYITDVGFSGVVPEPSSLALLGLGSICSAVTYGRRRQSSV